MVPGTEGYIEKTRIEESIPEKEKELKKSKKYKEATQSEQSKMRQKLRSPLQKYSKSPFAQIKGSFVDRTGAENEAIAKKL